MKKASIAAVLTLLISASSALKADDCTPPFPDRGKPGAPRLAAAPNFVDQILAFLGISL